MIYAAFIMWIFLVFVTGMGLYRLWTRYFGGRVVDWLMFPATLVSELLYSLGRMITGRPAYGGIISPKNPSEDACRMAIAGKSGFLVALLASLLAILGSLAALIALICWGGRDIIGDLVSATPLSETVLPKELPVSWNDFWDQLQYQVTLLRRLIETLGDQDWLDWQVPMFVYGISVLSVRLGPVRHDQRASFAVAGAMAALLAAIASLIEPVQDMLEQQVWYTLSYIWATLLLLLAVTLLIMAMAGLVRLFVPRTGRE
jgi:hypothetical protein